MFNIIGDTIEFDGQRVAVIRADVIPTVRAEIEAHFIGADSTALDDLQSEIDTLEDDNAALRTERDELETERDELASKVKALNALLGIKE